MEGWLSNLTRPDQKVVALSGPWNTPQLAINKTRAVAAALKEADFTHAEQYDQNAKGLEAQFSDLAQDQKRKALLKKTGEINVLCMDWQKGFVSHLGFNITKTYGSENTLPIKDVNDLIQSGKDQGVLLVIDNLQSGTQTGEQIAQEINAKHVVLTNFPGAVPGTDNLMDMLKYNGDKLLAAVYIIRACPGYLFFVSGFPNCQKILLYLLFEEEEIPGIPSDPKSQGPQGSMAAWSR